VKPVAVAPGPVQSPLGRALLWLHAVEKAVAVAAMVVVAGALTADLLGREVLGSGIFGAQRVAVYATVVAGLIGFALATAENRHLRVQAIDRLLPRRWDGALDRAASVVSAVICLWLAWFAWRFVGQTFAVGERSMTLGIPVWPIQIVLPYAFASAALRHLAFAISPALRPKVVEGE